MCFHDFDCVCFHDFDFVSFGATRMISLQFLRRHILSMNAITDVHLISVFLTSTLILSNSMSMYSCLTLHSTSYRTLLLRIPSCYASTKETVWCHGVFLPLSAD